MEDEIAVGIRPCEAPGCPESALYRAPRSPGELNRFYWFCIKHVREYNQAWDYFQGMSADQIEAYRHAANTWHRPTWPMSVNGKKKSDQSFDWTSVHDLFGVFAESGNPFERHDMPLPRVDKAVAKALATLELAPKATAQDVKTRYKALAKKFHPDLNGGSKTAEERLKQINEAYSCLVAAGYA